MVVENWLVDCPKHYGIPQECRENYIRGYMCVCVCVFQYKHIYVYVYLRLVHILPPSVGAK